METGPIRICAWGHGAVYKNYEKAFADCGGVLCAPDEAQSCSGLLLQGGGDLEPWRYGQCNYACRNLEPERDAAEWELLRFFVAAKRPVLGICRGIQTINVYFGGDLIQDLPGHSATAEGDRRHTVTTADCVLRDLYGRCMEVNSAHHQGIGALGEALCAVQHAPDGVIEAVVHRTLPILGVQWHPERLRGAADGRALIAAFLDRCRQQ